MFSKSQEADVQASSRRIQTKVSSPFPPSPSDPSAITVEPPLSALRPTIIIIVQQPLSKQTRLPPVLPRLLSRWETEEDPPGRADGLAQFVSALMLSHFSIRLLSGEEG